MSHVASRRLSASRIFARLLIIAGCLALTVLLVFHQQVPDVAGLGLVIDNLAPWLGLGVPVLLLLALAARGRGTFLMLLVPAVAWALIFGPMVVPAPAREPVQGLKVATQNVHERQVDSAARSLAQAGAEVIALQELGAGQDAEVSRTLASSHPYHFSVSTVGVWSTYPISRAEPLDLGLDWDRALRLDVETAAGPVRLYTVHAASARPTGHGDRDMMLRNLAGYVQQDPSPRIVAAGDFNATSTDRHFAPVSGQLELVRYSRWGLALTWPRQPFPVLGIDHVLVRGVEPAGLERVEAGDSDHLGLVSTLDVSAP